MLRMGTVICLICMLSSSAASAQSPIQHQKNANQALQSQLSKEGKDCPEARTNLEDKVCIGQVKQQTEQDFATFFGNLKELLDSTGQANLEDAQQAWLAYRQKSCTAIESLFQGGTGRLGFEARCEIQLTRSRMKDLDAIYNLPLHH